MLFVRCSAQTANTPFTVSDGLPLVMETTSCHSEARNRFLNNLYVAWNCGSKGYIAFGPLALFISLLTLPPLHPLLFNFKFQFFFVVIASYRLSFSLFFVFNFLSVLFLHQEPSSPLFAVSY